MKKSEQWTVWQVPAYLPYVQPILTDEVIEEAERKIGGKLPTAYLELLRIQNGGYLRFTGLGGLHTVLNGIGPYYPNLLDIDWSVYDEEGTGEREGLFPLDGDGHWYLCLDYRSSKDQPPVTAVFTESDREEPVADSFEEYVALLRLETEEIYVWESEQSLAEAAQALQHACKTEWSGPDTFSHGYPVYRTNWHEGWIWISSNLVPHGFVRQNDNRFDELKDLMNGTALQYPELLATALLIQVSDEPQGAALQALLADNGVTLKPLHTHFGNKE